MRGGPVEALHGELMLEGPVADPERAIGSDSNNARSSSRVSILPRLDMVGHSQWAPMASTMTAATIRLLEKSSAMKSWNTNHPAPPTVRARPDMKPTIRHIA